MNMNETPEHYHSFESRVAKQASEILSWLNVSPKKLFLQGMGWALLDWIIMVLLGAYGVHASIAMTLAFLLFIGYLVYTTIHAMNLFYVLIIPFDEQKKDGVENGVESQKRSITFQHVKPLQEQLKRELGRWGIVYRQKFWEILGFSLAFNSPFILLLLMGRINEWYLIPSGILIVFVGCWMVYIPLVESCLLIIGKPKTAH